VVDSAELDLLLEKLRREKAHLISVTPLHGSLEDYFVAHTSDQEAVRR
jgi:uncharacterized protein (UPF0262 family)